MASLKDIEEFLKSDTIAVAGMSRDPKKFSRMLFNNLRSKDFDLIPVNPHTDEIEGEKCYRDVMSLPDEVKKLLIITPKKVSENVIRDAMNKGIERVWIQQGAGTPEALEIAAKSNMKIINEECILMYAKPVKGIHSFHAFLRKLFGKYPK